MKYKVYFKGSLCNVLDDESRDFILNMSKKQGEYPYKFETSINLDVDGNYVDFSVTPLNERSAYILNSVEPCISFYTRHYPKHALTNTGLRARNHKGKQKHWKWSLDDSTSSSFDYGYYDGREYDCGIYLDQMDSRVLSSSYRVSLRSSGSYRYHPETYVDNSCDVNIAFRIILITGIGGGVRVVCASEPKFIKFTHVGGGSYDEIIELSEQEYNGLRPSYDDDRNPNG